MNKKSIIGVGVLIIFLSTILAASITAGVLIRTSGVLQQKAIDVERTVRERLITSVEAVSATAQGNETTQKINNLELFVRLRAGSSAISLAENFFTISTQKMSATADLLDPYDYYRTTQVITVNTTNGTSIADLDGDGIVENVSIAENYNSTLEAFNITLSRYGSVYVSLEADISNASTANQVNIRLRDEPIRFNNTIIGYVHVRGLCSTAKNLGPPLVMFFSPVSFTCDFATLPAETKFCAYAFVGNEDHVVDAGELIGIKFKLKDSHLLDPGEEIEIQMVPKEGDLMRLNIKMPNLVKSTIRLL